MRYDCKKANRNNLRVGVWRGWRGISCLREILDCRRAVIGRSGNHFRNYRTAFVEALRLCCKLLVFRQHALVALVISDDRCLAAFVGIEFGSPLYPITRGTKPNRMGAG